MSVHQWTQGHQCDIISLFFCRPNDGSQNLLRKFVSFVSAIFIGIILLSIYYYFIISPIFIIDTILFPNVKNIFN